MLQPNPKAKPTKTEVFWVFFFVVVALFLRWFVLILGHLTSKGDVKKA